MAAPLPAPGTSAYLARRAWIEEYFDRTAAATWARLTSDAPVGSVRATVRAGRDQMRALLLGWLPTDLAGRRILDAGCGTGALAVELARRGAEVVAIDLSRTLTDLARERAAGERLPGSIDFRAGDMLDPGLGRFDHVVAMDSIIHYAPAEAVAALAALAPRVAGSMVFTVAPRTPVLALMHAMGQLFPRGNRSPSIQPVAVDDLRRRVAGEPAFAGWRFGRTARVQRGFYVSQAVELAR